MTKTALFILLAMVCINLYAQDTIHRKKYTTQLLSGTITLDGKLTEESWNAVEWGGDFLQWQPNEGSRLLSPPISVSCTMTNSSILLTGPGMQVLTRSEN